MPIIRRKNNIPDDKKFDGQGVDFKSKLIGVATVSAPRGDEICQEAISDLKATALKNNKEKKEHKQKITINITIKGIRLIDDATERIDHAHPIHRISFISHDNGDKRTFGYIVGTKEGYRLFALKTAKEAEVITRTLKDLFQEVFKRHQAKKEEEGVEEAVEEGEKDTNETEDVSSDAQIEAAEDAVEGTDSNVLWDELNDQIQEMQQVGMPHSDTFDMLSDPYQPQDQTNGFDDNFFPDQNNINPFDEVRNGLADDKNVDFFSLPAADALKKGTNDNDLFSVEPIQTKKPVKSTSYSEDLYTLPNPPSRNTTKGVASVANEEETVLMRHDPFVDLKKNLNELHQQNIIQQQQQQSMTFAAAFPNMTHQMHQPQMYAPRQPNPFGGNLDYSNASLQPPLPSRPVPVPVVPSRPSPAVPETNPFLLDNSPQTQHKPDMGWSVLQPTVAPTKAEPVQPTTSATDDPFAFLNEQTYSDTPAVSTSTTNQDLVDFLG